MGDPPDVVEATAAVSGVRGRIQVPHSRGGIPTDSTYLKAKPRDLYISNKFLHPLEALSY